jgi:hypothetical protein
VLANGRIALSSQVPKEVNRSEAAEFWPYTDASGKPVPPPYGAVIAKPKQGPDMTPPTDVLGSAFLLANGDMVAPSKDTEPRRNVLWVRRNGDGLEIVRSGPRMKGQVYASVLADRRIILASAPDNPCGLWRTIDEQGGLATIAAGTRMPAPEPGEVVTQYDDWTITTLPGGGLRLNGASGGKSYATMFFLDEEGNPHIGELPKDPVERAAAIASISKEVREEAARKKARMNAETPAAVAP